MNASVAPVVASLRNLKRTLSHVVVITRRTILGLSDDERMFRLLLDELKALRRDAERRGPHAQVLAEIERDIAAFEDVLAIGGAIHRHDLYRVELAIADILPDAAIPARIEQYLMVVAQMLPPSQFLPWAQRVRASGESEVRAALRTVVGRMYRRITLSPAAERARGSLTMRAMLLWLPLTCATPVLALLFAGTWVFGGVGGVATGIAGSDAWSFALLLVLAFHAGSTGATISLIRRIHRIPVSLDPMAVRLHIEASRGTLALSPAIGGLFAVVFVGLVLSGLLGGDAIPSLEELRAGTGVTLAKLLVWCFAAGFAEQLVPDAIDRLAGRQRGGIGDESAVLADRVLSSEESSAPKPAIAEGAKSGGKRARRNITKPVAVPGP